MAKTSTETRDSAPPPARRPFEEWVAEKKPAAWLAAAARAMQGWAIGQEITEAQFTDALRDAGAIEMR
jgi:hypothetical protein